MSPTGDEIDTTRNPPPFADALRWWFKLGWISFGGPAGQIAIMHDELVERRRWLDEQGFLRALNYCMLLPGPEAQQLATYIGWRLHGVRGGIAAGVLFVLPSLLLLLLLSWLYVAYQHLPALAHVLDGLRPAVVAIIAAAAWRLGRKILKQPAQWAIAVAAFIALAWLRLPFPLLIGLAALAGWAFLRAPATSKPASIQKPSGFRWQTTLKLLAVCAALWLAGFLLLPAGTLRDMALFFSKAAFLTFGGAYAVLPYVDAAATQHYGWLQPGQMMDGLALGETTPGPLIIVVAFVGFVGGWNSAAGDPLALAIAGGLVATFFTFLPSFLLVLAGAPLIEASGRRTRFDAPLAGINAAVIGVIAHLALAFATHTFWRGGQLDVFNLLLAIAALLALVRFKLGVVPVMLLCALIGLLRGLLMSGQAMPG